MIPFAQVDVFTAEPYLGNPVAVVLESNGLDTEQMQQFANWTNLSETTFVLPPESPEADYRVRIFTPTSELPFAGHPTIGTCHAWLEAGGEPKVGGQIVQECGVGLVTLRKNEGRLAFAAPPLIRGGSVDLEDIEMACAVLQISRDQILGAQWADNGPGWLAIMLESAEAVLALEPDFNAVESYDVGVAGRYPLGVVSAPSKASAPDHPAIEVRAFFRGGGGQTAEDPVTGSLNASLAQWLLQEGRDGSPIGITAPYVAAQGTALGRAGRVHIEESDGEVWVGGDAVTAIAGTVAL